VKDRWSAKSQNPDLSVGSWHPHERDVQGGFVTAERRGLKRCGPQSIEEEGVRHQRVDARGLISEIEVDSDSNPKLSPYWLREEGVEREA
jgi:hypothetical protein